MTAPRKCRFIGAAPAVHTPRQGGVDPTLSWGTASDADRDQARARLSAVCRSEALSDGGMSRTDADRCAAREHRVSAKSIGKWRRRVRGLPAGERVAALLDGKRTGRPSSIDTRADWREALEAFAFHGGRHLTAEHARRTLVTRTGSAPPAGTLRRWLARWRTEHARELDAVTNPDRHRSHRQPAFGDAAEQVVGLNARWELDSTIADIICDDGRRRALVAAIDIWSRRALFLIAPTSRATAIAALLRRCLLAWGVPAAIRTDEGADYTSRHVLGVLADLEIEHLPCRPYAPEQKPFVERVIGTVSTDLFAHLPGFAGHSPADAAELRGRKSFAARRGETPANTFAASLTPDALQARLDAWAHDVYGRRAHSGLGGATPFNRAASWTGALRRISDARALDALLAAPVGGGTRVVGKHGLSVGGGAPYIAPELGPLVRERVHVRADESDPARIHVYRDADGRPGAFVCIAVDPARTGADRAAIAAEAKALAAAVDRDARRRARALERAHRPQTAMDDVLGAATEAADRVVAFPHAGKAHETPALAEAARAAQAADAPVPAAPGTARRGRRAVAAAALALFNEGA